MNSILYIPHLDTSANNIYSKEYDAENEVESKIPSDFDGPSEFYRPLSFNEIIDSWQNYKTKKSNSPN